MSSRVGKKNGILFEFINSRGIHGREMQIEKENNNKYYVSFII